MPPPEPPNPLLDKISEVIGATALRRLHEMTADDHRQYAEVAVTSCYDLSADLRARTARGERILVGADHEDYVMVLAAAWLILAQRLTEVT